MWKMIVLTILAFLVCSSLDVKHHIPEETHHFQRDHLARTSPPVHHLHLHPAGHNTVPLLVMSSDDHYFDTVRELIHQAVIKGLTKAVTSITERQDAIEKRTD